ncbi:MAG TPA: glutathione synthase [Myxococcota bacterium]|nr:glutathione synthase [Myxococcota bacterium]
MRHLFIVDPIAGLNPNADTSVVFMREAARRGHDVATCDVSALSIASSGRAQARWTETKIRETTGWYELGAERAGELGEFDVVWMRKDPPYDLNYFFATHLLDLVPKETLVVNSPRGLREVTEKLFILRFPDLCPESFVSRNIAELLAFREKLGGEMIIKPLDGCGGEGVFHLTKDDRNVKALLELGTKHGTTYQIAQRYVPEVREGDKRIIVVEGEPVGAVLRVPQAYESRANFHVGGTAAKTPLGAREREICARIGPALREYGIVFAGIDVIGRWLTEVNVTSPTGIQEINRLDGVRLEAKVLDAVERRLARAPQAN